MIEECSLHQEWMFYYPQETKMRISTRYLSHVTWLTAESVDRGTGGPVLVDLGMVKLRIFYNDNSHLHWKLVLYNKIY